MSAIYLRAAREADCPTIMKIINQAKATMKAAGSPQWQDGHPNMTMIKNDIHQGIGWLLVVDNQVAGYAALQLKPDPNYNHITDGNWQVTDQPYATFHRVAVGNRFRGHHLSKFLFSNLLTIGQAKGIRNFRLDTHRVNHPLQGLARDFGFKQRGIIHVQDKLDTARLAFELNLVDEHHHFDHITNDFMAPLLHRN